MLKLITAAALITCSTAFGADHKVAPVGSMITPRLEAKAARRTRRLHGLTALLHTRLETYLTNNASLAKMAALLADPQMGRLPETVQQPLRAEGASLTTERDGMLPQAQSLDAEDTALAQEQDRLNQEKAALDTRLADINQQVAQHNAACLPTHPPERHQWCVENAARLNALIGQYNADVRTHNSAVDSWKSRAAVLEPQWDSFVNTILDWEGRVKNLIDRIQKALELKDCAYKSGTSEIIRLDPVESKITCKYDCCGLPSETYHFIQGKPTQQEIDFICQNPLPRCPAPPALNGGRSK